MRATSQTWNRLLKQLSLSTRRLPARLLWGLAALSLSLLVLCCLPIAQIQLAGAQAQGMMGNYGSPILIGFTLSPTSVSGGQNVTATLLLQNPAPDGGATVSLTSDNSSVATVPATVNIPAGQNSATFWLATSQVTAATTVNLSATLGSVTLPAQLMVVVGAPGSLALSSNPVMAPNPASGTITLDTPAPSGGMAITLTSTNPQVASVPAGLTIPEGQTSATFPIVTSIVAVPTNLTLTAAFGGGVQTANLQVIPYNGPADHWFIAATYEGSATLTFSQPNLDTTQNLADLQNTPGGTFTGGITAQVSASHEQYLWLDEPAWSSSTHWKPANMHFRLCWLPANGDLIHDPAPQFVIVYCRRQVNTNIDVHTADDPWMQSLILKTGFDNGTSGLPALTLQYTMQNGHGTPWGSSTPPGNATQADGDFMPVPLATKNGVATFDVPLLFDADSIYVPLSTPSPYPPSGTGWLIADTAFRCDLCVAGFDMGRFHKDLTGLGGGQNDSSEDPSFTRWLPLSFSPLVSSQPFTMSNQGLSVPWGNLNCYYSMRLEQEPAQPNPDYEATVLQYLPSAGTDGTYNNPQGPYRVLGGGYPLTLTDADGERLQFHNDGALTPAPDVQSILSANGVGYTLSGAGPPGHLKERGHYTYTFETVGPNPNAANPALVARLTSIGDDLGNRQTLAYAGDGSTNAFLSVTDSSSGRQLIFNRLSPFDYVSSVDAPSAVPGVPNTHTTLSFIGGQLSQLNVYDGATNALLHSDTFGSTRTHGLSHVSYAYLMDRYAPDPFNQPIPRLTSTTLGLGDTASSDYGNQIAGTYHYTYGPIQQGYNYWGPLAHVNTLTDPRGSTTSTIYSLSGDPAGVAGSISSESVLGPDFTGAVPGSNFSSVSYSPDSHRPTLIAATDALMHTWLSTLDGFGNLTSLCDPNQDLWQFAYSPDGTLLTSVTDPTQLRWLFNYGENNNPTSRLTSVVDPGANTRVKIDYNLFGQSTSVTTPAAVAASGADEQTKFGYDALTGDLTKITDPLGDILTLGGYDALGDALSSTVYPDTGNPATSHMPITSSLTMDGAQEITSLQYANGLLGLPTYTNGVLTGVQIQIPPSPQAPQGTPLAQSGFTYDSRGRLYQVTDALGTPAQYRYDLNSNVTRVIDGAGNTTKLSYGANNEPTGILWPDNNQTSTTYDAAGRLASTTDERGVLTLYRFDPANRLTDLLLPAESAENVHCTYDLAGRLLSVTDVTGSTAFHYDPLLGRLQSVVTTLVGLPASHNSFTTSYLYYADGKLQSVTTPVGTTTYTYDADGQLISLTAPNGEITAWTYDHVGSMTSQCTTTSAATVLSTGYTYGVSGLANDPSTTPLYLSQIHQTVNGVPFWNYALQHSQIGQLLQQQGTGAQSGQGDSAAFTYDGRGRLSSENLAFAPDNTHNYTGGANYSFDAADNLQGGANGWSYNSSNQLTGASGVPGLGGGSGLAYDPAGNLVGLGGGTLSYDALGWLSQTGNASFTYDAAGRRVSKNGNGQTTFYLYDGDTLIAELDGNGNITRSYTWGANGLISDQTAAQGRYYLFDALGNTRALLNQNGNVLAQADYSAWGSTLGNGSLATPFAWNGQAGAYTDAETGFVLMGMRYYSPALGRFTSRDPIGFAGGMNVYGYCGGDPINGADLSGMDKENRVQGAVEDLFDLANKPFEWAGNGLYSAFKSAGTYGLKMDPNTPTLGNPYMDTSCEVQMVNGRYRHAGQGVIAGTNMMGKTICTAIAIMGVGAVDTQLELNFDLDDGDVRPTIKTELPDRVTKALPEGEIRTPAENARARNFFERNRDQARGWWEQRSGKDWPADATHDEHPRPLKDGGDPLFIEPGSGGSARPHKGGDFQRWGGMGGRPRKTP